jgi:hypothetical protein
VPRLGSADASDVDTAPPHESSVKLVVDGRVVQSVVLLRSPVESKPPSFPVLESELRLPTFGPTLELRPPVALVVGGSLVERDGSDAAHLMAATHSSRSSS